MAPAGGPNQGAFSSQPDPMKREEVKSFNPPSMMGEAAKDSLSPETSSPDPNTRKENSRKSKKDKPKKSKTKGGNKDKAGGKAGGSSEMTKLDDLPSLGGPPGRKPPGGFGRFGGFGAADDAEPVDDDSNDGFDDLDINEDVFGDSSNKFDDAERHLKDFYKEESEGFKISHGKKDAASKAKQAKKAGFKVNIQGMNNNDDDDDFEEEIIEEDI